MDEQPSTLNAELGPKARLEIYSAGVLKISSRRIETSHKKIPDIVAMSCSASKTKKQNTEHDEEEK